MRRLFMVLLMVGLSGATFAAEEKAPDPPQAEVIPLLVVEPGSDDWVVDRFAGNSTAGPKLIQGPAREAGGLGRPGSVACAPDGWMPPESQ
jgi:hypothetical protein